MVRGSHSPGLSPASTALASAGECCRCFIGIELISLYSSTGPFAFRKFIVEFHNSLDFKHALCRMQYILTTEFIMAKDS